MQLHWAVLQRVVREWSIMSEAPAGASHAEWISALERAIRARSRRSEPPGSGLPSTATTTAHLPCRSTGMPPEITLDGPAAGPAGGASLTPVSGVEMVFDRADRILSHVTVDADEPCGPGGPGRARARLPWPGTW